MSRPNPPTSSKSKKSRPTPAKAIPDLEKDVNALILDYLIVFAIDAALTAEEEGQGDAGESDADPDGGKGEMADWFGRVLDAFGHLPLPDYTHNAVQGQAQRQVQSEMNVDMDLDVEMAPDLPIKIQILNILTSLRHTSQIQSQIHSQTNQSQIPAERKNFAQIGLSFMNICLLALHKTYPAESRWMGISAEFLGLAIREHEHEHARTNLTDPDGTADPDDISRLKNWSSSNEDMDEKWNLIWRDYIARSSSTAGVAGPDAGDVKERAVSFIQDLMTTLDPPILLQLEGGKLGDLSFEETGDLLRRVGLLAGNGGGGGGGGGYEDEDEDGDEDGGGG